MGSGEGVERSSGLAARTLHTRTCHLPFCVGEVRGCGWVPLLSSLQVAFLDVRRDDELQQSSVLSSLLYPYEHMKWH